jgi:hypothetical protein
VQPQCRFNLGVAREGFGADLPRNLLLDVDGAPEWWPINQVTRTGRAAMGRPNGSVRIALSGSRTRL